MIREGAWRYLHFDLGSQGLDCIRYAASIYQSPATQYRASDWGGGHYRQWQAEWHPPGTPQSSSLCRQWVCDGSNKWRNSPLSFFSSLSLQENLTIESFPLIALCMQIQGYLRFQAFLYRQLEQLSRVHKARLRMICDKQLNLIRHYSELTGSEMEL